MTWKWALACAATLVAGPVDAQETPLPRLLSADSLEAWLARGQPVRLLDVRPDVWTYLRDHLPGAQYLNVETMRATRGGVPVQLLDAPAYRGLFQRLGLEPDVPVVVYSAGETLNIDATWTAWLLWSMGHPRLFVLDGGYFQWALGHRALEARYPRVEAAGGWWATRPFRADTVGVEQVRSARAGGALLVDARSPEQYRGEAGAQARRGHIPGAISRWWHDDLETRGFGRVFKPADQLRREYAALGIVPAREIILYCNTSTEASHLWFALRVLLGYPRVRIYAGSWTEWAGREDLPVELGPSRAAP
ncbi:MAG TPA: rhodanese-like domain-containing protein [Gemmatimonadales bacterium]|nr:rhodanese-like domain-containing protein [Gemmatimonadales bacterium]